ncbi:aminoglycoside adenylyltransferase family protein [Virgisporangium ochraceum]|uniref:Nucleotidyltransferase n=1 Tax=Virgisporangium ochraceum TaxID=65505 RepID=A0A8J3ZR26_9ACTN|nr:aminoglycoside adenylyltransferase domain-containing protein [Virgisporangium ochraceum]GIJ68354.1 nucleotidyltransferase [Virgisporangium ochraceum]
MCRNHEPTPFAELNAVLAELAGRAAAILGADFVGAYLQGSFAVGDADPHSDCDFLIPVHRQVTGEQEAALRALHDEFPTRPDYWAKRLEGSYPVLAELRTLDGLGRPWLYVDNGWREMQWSTHCNTEVVRWSLRECGVTLVGPPPSTLVDPVPASVLRERMRADVPGFVTEMESWISFDLAWAQRYAVTTLCRMLNTYVEGRVTSKRAALLWAQTAVDPRWRPLIERALVERDLGWDPDERPSPGSVGETLEFHRYVQGRMS